MAEMNEPWFLPDGIDELLPPQSDQLEQLRTKLLNLVKSYGYELVSPPVIEFLDSLLAGAGKEFNLQTFKLTDQLTGQLMGVRADMTPQVARIDACRLQHTSPNRLCYLDTVLRARPDGFLGSRSPLQFGAEIFGDQGIESDAEIISLMHDVLTSAGVKNVYLDLGHVGIFRGLTKQAGLSKAAEKKLFEMMQRKAKTEIKQFTDELKLGNEMQSMLLALSDLNGGQDTLERAKSILKSADAAVHDAIVYLEAVANQLRYRCPDYLVHFDLSELRGYEYHTGIVFAAFIPGRGQEIARGGRYDNIASAFGKGRPATGFSTDLKLLTSFLDHRPDDQEIIKKIYAPCNSDPLLWQMISSLRKSGDIVICELSQVEQTQMGSSECNYQLVPENNRWVVVEI